MDSETLVIAITALVGLGMVVLAVLAGWHGWLALKMRELDHHVRPAGDPDMRPGSPEGAARIEIADLKERIRKLEAIASGVDL